MATVPIVVVNTSVVQAPTPNNLQQRGALVTLGGTSTAAGTLTLCSTLADVVALLAPAKALTSLTWSGGVVTVTTTAPHGWGTGDVIPITIAGVTPAAYNGSFQSTVTGASTFTYALASNPGTMTVAGTATLAAVTTLRQMATTYFAGNGVPAVSVLELGESTVTAGVASLITFLSSVSGTSSQQYAYLLPREWDNNPAFLSLCSSSTGVDKMLYFYVTTTIANETVYSTPAYKCVYAGVEAPGKPATEFSMASVFGTVLKTNPSSTNKVPPLSYSPSYGTTAYPQAGNQSVFQALANNNVGWIASGQQGGVSGNIVFQGKMSDGNSWNFWYSVDWAQINIDLAIANEVINGSATPLSPLYYNQQGINRLQHRAVQIVTQGVAAGLANGQVLATRLPIVDFLAKYNAGEYAGKVVVNAEPFLSYSQANPSDYGIGKYAGLSCIWVSQLPFLNVFFNLQATTLITGG
jgi:hypothetical protein